MSVGVLILYHRRSGDRQVHVFDGPDGRRAAVLERLRLEADPAFPAESAGIEIAAISGDSLEVIQQSHSRYFTGQETNLLAMIERG